MLPRSRSRSRSRPKMSRLRIPGGNTNHESSTTLPPTIFGRNAQDRDWVIGGAGFLRVKLDLWLLVQKFSTSVRQRSGRCWHPARAATAAACEQNGGNLNQLRMGSATGWDGWDTSHQYLYFLTLRLWALHVKNRLQKAFVPLNIRRVAELVQLRYKLQPWMQPHELQVTSYNPTQKKILRPPLHSNNRPNIT